MARLSQAWPPSTGRTLLGHQAPPPGTVSAALLTWEQGPHASHDLMPATTLPGVCTIPGFLCIPEHLAHMMRSTEIH